MQVGDALLDMLAAAGARCVAVIGTGKNVGKTVTLRAVYEAAAARGLTVGVVSAGRDGEAIDVIERIPKPRLRLVPGTWIASAPRTTRRLELHELADAPMTACGPLELARVLDADDYELVGPPTAAGLRRAIDALRERCDVVLVDGAIDRVATVASGEDAIVVACGAAAADTLEDAAEDVRALVERLQTPLADPSAPSVFVDGALVDDTVNAFLAANERRQIVVRSPAALTLSRQAWRRARALRLACEQPARVLAVTVAPEASRRSFDPRAFLDAVASATGLPVFDVYAGTHALSAKPA